MCMVDRPGTDCRSLLGVLLAVSACVIWIMLLQCAGFEADQHQRYAAGGPEGGWRRMHDG